VSDDSFRNLIQRLRAGEESAARELVERYGPHIQRIARIRLQGSGLRRVVESADICQSVLANFCLRAVEGQFELESPDKLLALLSTMTRNHVLKKLAYHSTQRRDLRRQGGSEEKLDQLANREKTPSVLVSNAEMMDHVRRLLNEDERYLLEQRAAGRSWMELSEELGVPPDRIRKQAKRAAERLAVALLEDDDEPWQP
jgi:RNA polymerase sigma factor (sigma-70 family)